MAPRLRWIAQGFRAALRREEIPPATTPAPAASAGPGLLRVVLMHEFLPQAPPAAPPSERGFLSILFARESPGIAAPPPVKEPSRWLGWLFRPEHLDD